MKNSAIPVQNSYICPTMKKRAPNSAEHYPLLEKKYRIFFHLFFWFAYIGSITLFFGRLVNMEIVFVRTTVSAAFNAILVYFNLYFLLPRYFEKKKYTQYLIFFHVALLVVSAARVYTDYIFPYHFSQGALLKQYLFTPTHYTSIIISGYIVVVMTMSMKFIKDYFVNIELRHRMQLQKVESELRELRNQVNPHFLFNVLGNIYSLAYMKSDKAPLMISKLSDMMRYILYDCKSPLVPLHKEIEYLNNFIDLHQLRKEGKMNIRFEVEGNPGNFYIQPLLFLPLFENCFKHGNLEDIANGKMRSKLTVRDNTLRLEIENSYKPKAPGQTKEGGVGLENIRNRLALLYPGRHSLKISHDNGMYRVVLTLEQNTNQ